MAAPRGRQQRGRSTNLPPDRRVRASVVLEPGGADRAIYEWLVDNTGQSGAEVLRRAMRSFARERGCPVEIFEETAQAS